MAHPVIMPRQGQSVEACIITEWKKKEGDQIQVGDILFSYETDKASFEEEAKQAGQLLKVFFEEDDEVPVLTTVAVIGEAGEDVSSFVPEDVSDSAEEPAKADESEAVVSSAAAPAAHTTAQITHDGHFAASPRARATAERLGLDIRDAVPTGPHGRVIERDVFAIDRRPQPADAVEAAPMVAALAPEVEYTDIKLPNLRKVIARTMHESLSNMAQLTHHSSFDATKLLQLRARFKAAPEELGVSNITINDLILFAVSRILVKHPALNAHFLNDMTRQFTRVQMGVAVDTPRGLLVPTLRDADTKSLAQISKEAKALAKDAIAGSINPDLLTGGSFTVTNLGSLGIEHFTPIINPPQVAILGVNCAVDRVREVEGKISVYPAMGLSLTYDHRAVDGAPASRFLKDLCQALTHIDVLIAG